MVLILKLHLFFEKYFLYFRLFVVGHKCFTVFSKVQPKCSSRWPPLMCRALWQCLLLFPSAMLSQHGSHEPHDNRCSKSFGSELITFGNEHMVVGNGSQLPTHQSHGYGTTTIHTPFSSIPLWDVLCVRLRKTCSVNQGTVERANTKIDAQSSKQQIDL
jgi:hypothetical protein